MTDLKTGLPSSLSDAKNSIDNAFTRRDLRGLNFENAFAGATSFMRRKYTKDLTGVDLAVTGVPFDQAVTNRPGARFGPRAVREASTLQTFDPPYGWDVDPFSTHAIIDYGDLAFDYAHTPSFPSLLKSHIKGILHADVACLSLGGDHYISFPIMQAYAEKVTPTKKGAAQEFRRITRLMKERDLMLTPLSSAKPHIFANFLNSGMPIFL